MASRSTVAPSIFQFNFLFNCSANPGGKKTETMNERLRAGKKRVIQIERQCQYRTNALCHILIADFFAFCQYGKILWALKSANIVVKFEFRKKRVTLMDENSNRLKCL